MYKEPNVVTLLISYDTTPCIQLCYVNFVTKSHVSSTYHDAGKTAINLWTIKAANENIFQQFHVLSGLFHCLRCSRYYSSA